VLCVLSYVSSTDLRGNNPEIRAGRVVRWWAEKPTDVRNMTSKCNADLEVRFFEILKDNSMAPISTFIFLNHVCIAYFVAHRVLALNIFQIVEQKRSKQLRSLCYIIFGIVIC